MTSPRPPEGKQDNWPFNCGCRVQRDADVGLIVVDVINFCPLHASAPKLVAALEESLAQFRFYDGKCTIKNHDIELMNKIEALLQEARGERR